MRLAVLFHRFGPYHIARLAASAKQGDLIGIELSGSGGEYAWKPVSTEAFHRLTVFPDGDTNRLPPTERIQRIEGELNKINPDALAIAGYSDPGMLTATRWGIRRGKKLILMSDSQYHDEPRKWWKEWIKRRLVSCFGSGFVAGTTHREYLINLGMPREKIYVGYDVVDNDYFSAGADTARNDLNLCSQLQLPQKYFFTSARFVPKKNLSGLIDAYAEYRKQCSNDPWDLVIAGDGPLRKDLESQIDRLGIGTHVLLPGFLQYDQLPAYYGMASAFVLPSLQDQWGLVVNEAMACGLPVIVSNVCGSAADLVHDGENGYQFSPMNTDQLARCLTNISTNEKLAATMADNNRRCIANWSVDHFSRSLWNAAEAATKRPSIIDRLAFEQLSRRLIDRR